MIERAVDELYSLLVQGKFSEIEKLTGGHRLPAHEISEAIAQYGRTLAPYPSGRALDVIEIAGALPKAWSVVAPVYTQEEGLSDLSIELKVIESSSGCRVELDDIHVL